MKAITKIKLFNFKRFKTLSIDVDEKINLFIGDNESGKSSILSAIDITLSGSRQKVETLGLENVFNSTIVKEFLESERKYENLPILFIELYLNEQDNPELNGRCNSDDRVCDGLRFICEPDHDLSDPINKILKQEEPNFPFEFYSISFKTFADEAYSGYRKFLRHVLIDNTQISNEYATRDYIRSVYDSQVNSLEKNKHQNEYRKYKEKFRRDVLVDVNDRIADYSFSVKSGSKSSLETDLTILEDDIDISNRGKGRQCFIKTDFALKKKIRNSDLDIVLIEEPENHLSHGNMKRLIQKINESDDRQLFISTHNDLISTRLDLRKSILLNSSGSTPISLQHLPEATAKFFMKAPNNKVLEYILSKKVILVEGAAEYILMDVFFSYTTHSKLEERCIQIISVGGTSFKRYLDIAKLLGIKTAVIRDNDGDFQENCINRYSQYASDTIRIFYDENNINETFEISVYSKNKTICDELFASERKALDVQNYMLSSKTEAAFELLEKKALNIIPPAYIQEAIEWINE